MSWAEKEFRDLGDERIKNRAIKLLEIFAKPPKASIAQACES
ncbi:transposase DNA-binding-containing protein [Methyloprofundus sp.]